MKIIVSTIYNPFPQVVGTNIYTASEQFIRALNAVIMQTQMSDGTANYAIADIYTAFKAVPLPVTNFSLMLIWGISGSFFAPDGQVTRE